MVVVAYVLTLMCIQIDFALNPLGVGLLQDDS